MCPALWVSSQEDERLVGGMEQGACVLQGIPSVEEVIYREGLNPHKPGTMERMRNWASLCSFAAVSCPRDHGI